MAKIYFVRHQAEGVVTQFPFSAPPSEEQVAAVSRFCFQSWGPTHPKGDPYWTRVVEFDVLGPSEVPDVPQRALSLSKENVAEPGKNEVSARGTVTNP
jgi:hypothetical protein